MSSAVEPTAARFRQAAVFLEEGLDAGGLAAFESILGPRDVELGRLPLTNERAAWALLGMHSVARLALRAGGNLSLVEAEEFFCGEWQGESRLSSMMARGATERAEDALRLVGIEALEDLLPYVLDHHRAGSRRQVLQGQTDSLSRRNRKRQGVFYTPADVAEFMARWATHEGTAPKLLDPACGTGVFLLAAARAYVEKGQPTQQIVSSLYGIDIDPIALDVCSFVLTAFILSTRPGTTAPLRLWHRIRLNLAERDALTVLVDADGLKSDSALAAATHERATLVADVMERDALPPPRDIRRWTGAQSLAVLFPEASDGFDALVGNPPYAPLGVRSDLAQLASRIAPFRGIRVTPDTNLFIPFLEFMRVNTRATSRSAMIVPMSVAYSRLLPMKKLRQVIAADVAQWTFRFFDRTPDALFGDDVKQRSAIVTRESGTSGEGAVWTSGIHRWTSRSRPELFQSLPPLIRLVQAEIGSGIPKLSWPWELRLYDAIRIRRGRWQMEHSLRPVPAAEQSRDRLVAVGTTAYNWLSVYRAGCRIDQIVNHNAYEALSASAADWSYAVLCSRLVYWLWRVDGDGFHVPSSFLAALPFEWTPAPESDRISKLGHQLWLRALTRPLRSINSARDTVSYPTAGDAILRDVDQYLVESLQLPPSTAEELANFVALNTTVGRAVARDHRVTGEANR